MNIVIDANALAFYFLNHPDFTPSVEQFIERKRVSLHAPTVWRSELQNVLMKYVRSESKNLPGSNLTLEQAIRHMADANLVVGSIPLNEQERILRLADESGCSTYDCEYVRLAQVMDTRLVTWDQEVLDVFPATAITPEDLAARLESSERDE